MRLKSLVVFGFLLTTPACGDDDGDKKVDGGPGGRFDAMRPDAVHLPVDASRPDGGPADADAMMTTDECSPNPTGTGLGTTCNGMMETCPMPAPMCAELDMPQNGGFCTLQCGTTAKPATGDPMAPVACNSVCTAGYAAGQTGTPSCVLYVVEGNQVKWYCGIVCGMANGMDYGMCPNPFTCQGNICDD